MFLLYKKIYIKEYRHLNIFMLFLSKESYSILLQFVKKKYKSFHSKESKTKQGNNQEYL